MQRAHEILSRIYSEQARSFGSDNEDSLDTAGHLADAKRDLGRLAEAIALRRSLHGRLERVYGETHHHTLENEVLLAALLDNQGAIDEAREIFERMQPVVRRILGPDHRLTHHITAGLSWLSELDRAAR